MTTLIVQRPVFNPKLIGKAVRIKYDNRIRHSEELAEIREAKMLAPEGMYIVLNIGRDGEELILSSKERLKIKTVQMGYVEIKIWEDEN